jgi:alpha-tubulin suppressor-like RCC1 family protein
VSYTSAFFLAPDGSLWVCGKEVSFVKTPTDVPQRIGGGRDWRQVAHRFNLAAALKADGSLWTWPHVYGLNANELVEGSRATAREPKQLGRDKDWKELSAGASHAVALKRDGTLWAWGQNDRGQVGDGTRENRKEPVRISEARDWRAITASHFNGYALKGDGTIWGWGIGMQTKDKESDVLEPGSIDEGTNWVAMSAGDYHLVATKRDGTLWLLGHNADVAAPDFGARSTSNFVQVGRDTNWVGVYSGANSFLARKRDGSWWGCGQNSHGELGIRNDSDVKSPTALPLVFEPWALDAGGTRTVLLTGDGALWIWGKPLGPEDAGLGAKLKRLINTVGSKAGLKRIFREPPQHRPDPVKIWEAPVE